MNTYEIDYTAPIAILRTDRTRPRFGNIYKVKHHAAFVIRLFNGNTLFGDAEQVNAYARRENLKLDPMNARGRKYFAK